MTQQPKSYHDAMPCPECGSTELKQLTLQAEHVEVTNDGYVEHISPDGTVEVQELWCTECDDVIWSKENDNE